MTENERINKIAREICHLSGECKTCQICSKEYPIEEGELCYYQCIAKEIMTYDCRKASEVAREIFEEIDGIIDTYGDEYGTMLIIDEEGLTELKKKYGGDTDAEIH